MSIARQNNTEVRTSQGRIYTCYRLVHNLLSSCLLHNNTRLKYKQDRQRTYDVTLRRVREIIVAVEKQWVLHIVSVYSFRYPAYNAHAPYCNLWTTPLYNILPHFLINGAISEEELLNIKCVFWFTLHLSLTFLILRRNEQHIIKMCIGLLT
jgi:hypothetical protein